MLLSLGSASGMALFGSYKCSEGFFAPDKSNTLDRRQSIGCPFELATETIKLGGVCFEKTPMGEPKPVFTPSATDHSQPMPTSGTRLHRSARPLARPASFRSASASTLRTRSRPSFPAYPSLGSSPSLASTLPPGQPSTGTLDARSLARAQANSQLAASSMQLPTDSLLARRRLKSPARSTARARSRSTVQGSTSTTTPPAKLQRRTSTTTTTTRTLAVAAKTGSSSSSAPSLPATSSSSRLPSPRPSSTTSPELSGPRFSPSAATPTRTLAA